MQPREGGLCDERSNAAARRLYVKLGFKETTQSEYPFVTKRKDAAGRTVYMAMRLDEAMQEARQMAEAAYNSDGQYYGHVGGTIVHIR